MVKSSFNTDSMHGSRGGGGGREEWSRRVMIGDESVCLTTFVQSKFSLPFNKLYIVNQQSAFIMKGV